MTDITVEEIKKIFNRSTLRGVTIPDLHDLFAILRERMIIMALDKHGWNKMRAAKELGIPRPNIIFYIKKLGLIQKEKEGV